MKTLTKFQVGDRVLTTRRLAHLPSDSHCTVEQAIGMGTGKMRYTLYLIRCRCTDRTAWARESDLKATGGQGQ